MVAFLGFSSQAAVQGMGPIECLQKHLADPGHNNSARAAAAAACCLARAVFFYSAPAVSLHTAAAHASPSCPPACPARPPCAVFTSSVGNEAMVACLVLGITPCLIEAKNRLQGTDEDEFR